MMHVWPQGGAGRHLGLAVWQVAPLLLMLPLLVMGDEAPSGMLSHPFSFTQEEYQADIPENAFGKSLVKPREKMGIYLSDPTLNIKYKVTGGDGKKIFKCKERLVGDFSFLSLHTRTGQQGALNRERKSQYEVLIKATGTHKNWPSYNAETRVMIHVVDENDLSPLFYPMEYTVSIPENTTIHTSIAQVSASDADIGRNGDVYYSLSKPTNQFAVHPTSGVVTLTGAVSFHGEAGEDHILEVVAVDRGPKRGRRRMSSAKLTVSVQEVNLHAPTLKLQELPSVGEEGLVGTVYAVLYVFDQDVGTKGEIANVSIASGDSDNFFTLEKTSDATRYLIKVARRLDRERYPQGFNLTVLAVDRGVPPRSTKQNVYVQLQDTNDNAPQFEKADYWTDIDECVPVHTPLLFVSALDVDLSKNAAVQYFISQGNLDQVFSIDRDTGLIKVSRALDAEMVDSYSLTVQAQDQGNPGHRNVGETTVKISVLDCNDNSPVFNVTPSMVTVREGEPVGTEVYQIRAYDLDQEDNGYVSYSIANEDETPFTIEHFSGKITTTKVLDYEMMRRLYRLRVRASDWGSPYRRESEMVLNIKVKDANDNTPKFEKIDCTGYLSREAPIGTLLRVVSALDFDRGNIINYKLISGNDDGCFELLSSSGELKTNCDLTSLQENMRVLRISAVDGKNQAEFMYVNITLVNSNRNQNLANSDANFICKDTTATQEYMDLLTQVEEKGLDRALETIANVGQSQFMVNQYTPKFIPGTVTSLTLKEGLPIGEMVASFTAEDPDHGYNGLLAYSISSGNEGSCFNISTYKGNLVVQAEIDRELQDSFMLNITVTDMGQPARSTFTMLSIQVEDINDNAPTFKHQHNKLNLLENIDVNTTVLRIAAEDRDLGHNSQITYSIQSHITDFAIDPVSGIIRINRPLDRETTPYYNLSVVASDSAPENPMSSTVIVSFTVDDVNDNPPRFVPESYVVRVPEDMPVGSVVLTVTAFDPDDKQNGKVRYSLQAGMDDKFEIDQNTGVVRLSGGLDYERKLIYNMTLRGRDHGDPNLFSRCQLVVEVVDVDENQHAPRFSDYVEEGSVPENEPVGTIVMRVEATDADIHQDHATSKDYSLTYGITDGTGLGFFTIDNTGTIRTSRVLDRETKAYYWLTVYAHDRGTVPRSSFTEVYVAVQDVNDNVPQTPQPAYYPSILENSSQGTTVLKLQAEDRDQGRGSQLTYTITSGNPQGFFDIDALTGVITTTGRKLDREDQEEHTLEVTISDAGEPALWSTTRVTVMVLDENDQDPEFLDYKGKYRVYLPALPTAPPGHSHQLYRVLAFDGDTGPNADLDFSIREGKHVGRFKIHPRTGMIYSTKEFPDGGHYELLVAAVDQGSPQRESTARVLFMVEGALTESEHAPHFLETGRTEQVFENDAVGRMVCLVSAEDADHDKLWYSITGGNEGDVFSMHPENGNILLARTLDWETKSQYNLTVAVTDTVHTVTTWVVVTVVDVNDNQPMFSKGAYRVDLKENVTPGTAVLTVTATDLDGDKRLFYTIHATMDKASNGKFKINSETDAHGDWTGVVTVLEQLDREAASQHQLTLMVRDQGTSTKRSFATLLINVLDVNDHMPTFLAEKFTANLFETAAPGTAVVSVVALDRDRGHNANIKYTIMSGNVGGTFSIDSALGLITLLQPLDRHKQAVYSLIVKARDGGTPSMSNTVPVEITVNIASDAPPRFLLKEHTTEVVENGPAGGHVFAVTATSASTLVYDIVSGDDDGLFDVNSNSGVISNRRSFDYEDKSFFNLTVRATNLVGAYADTTVMVHVVDQNDNKPEFQKVYFEGWVSEVTAPGSVVLDAESTPLVIRASDDDTGDNALLVYSILDPEAADMFDIDSSTGAIRTRVQLDHEMMAEVEFTVQVFDKGSPSFMADIPATVMIHVDDVNDSPPTFSEDQYHALLLLPSYPGILVTQVQATDADSGPFSQLAYRIVDGDPDSHFVISDTSGDIIVKDVLHLAGSYQITVRASDGTYDSDVLVDITIDTAQETGLHFSHQKYSAELAENGSEVEQLMVLQVVGHDLNEHLSFSMLNPSPLFDVGHTSGVVQTTGQPANREKQNNYTLVVEVRDERSPPRLAHALVHVTITDVNDNSPRFVKQPYYAILSVNSRTGDLVKQVKAIDVDIGDNGMVEYTLAGDIEKHFMMEPETGKIKLATPFDPNQQNIDYVLMVQAMDKGSPPLHSQVEVHVSVVNQATPVFTEPFYAVTVPENLPPQTTVVSVQASSPTGRKLIYSITDGDKYNEFTVDFNTGAITLIDVLDYDASVDRREYRLTIRATDIDTGAYSEAIVQMRLQDVNDNPPSFESYMYMKTVSEAVAVGTPVLTVLARDADSGANADIRYNLEPSDPDNHDLEYFQIDEAKGVISTKSLLDYELFSRLHLRVVATDSGFPALSSVVDVKIIVTDLNDNPPVFDKPSYQVNITDLVKRGQFITMVTASDPDSSDTASLTYSILGGNDRQVFSINASTGWISLSSLRKPKLLSSYSLNVSVTDDVYKSFTQVHIHVTNSNNNAPRFGEDTYDVDVVENMRPGRLVALLRAVDEDQGVYGEVTYSIESDEARDVFNIDENTGELVTAQRLDREHVSRYLVPIVARDGGGRAGYTSVTVNVADQGDFRPLFLLTNYKTNIYSNTSVDASIITVTAIDSDLGSNGDLTYSLTDSDGTPATEWFTIEEGSGVIRLKQSISSHENELLQFFVQASDQSSPPQESSVPIDVYVMSPNDMPPVFDQDHYMYYIEEDRSVGSVITKLTCRTNQSVTYSIVSGDIPATNNPGYFNIDEGGSITILESLDRETVDHYDLTIKAQTHTSPPLVAHTLVKLQILDVNDNSPIFENDPYLVTIAENADIGSSVVQVIARDSDNGGNQAVSYQLASEDVRLSSVFSLNSETGWISTLVVLDREKVASFTFRVVASDHGTEPRSDTTIVTVTVTDHNDQPPVFSRTMYQAQVYEDAPVDTIVVTVTTTDGDEPDNAVVTYYITSGDPLGQFAITDSGELKVHKPLDREVQGAYELTISATDGAFVTKTTIKVTIQDVNDNSPICEKPMYTHILPENNPEQSAFLRVRAKDADQPGSPNSMVEYWLEGENHHHFNMHKDSGYISVETSLDRESVSQYTLTVMATDQGGLFCSAQLYVTVTDVNDNAPMFTQNEYTVTVPEDAPLNTLLTRVTATDADLGINRRVLYAIHESEGIFTIDAKSGIISLNRELDREQQHKYNLSLYAYDQGTPRMTSMAYLVVLVVDINDNPPEFERTSYISTFPEDTLPGTSIANVFATSKDTGVNAEIKYDIISGNDQGLFSVHPETGIVNLVEPLDYEIGWEYHLQIEARDGGTPPLFSTTQVIVNVTDVNDNKPMFARQLFRTEIQEDTMVSYTLIKLHAVDMDGPENGGVMYSLAHGNLNQQFSIDSMDGSVTLSKELDREEVSSYALEIHAIDSGEPALTGITMVNVKVVDINDNPPMFTKDNFTGVIQENSFLGYSLLQVEVYDLDLDPNGAPFRFDLVEGKVSDFRIDQDGVLYTMATFDMDLQDLYELTVRVFDSGDPVLHSDTKVYVHIIEESAFPPIIKPLIVTVTAFNDYFGGGVIGSVSAIDPDPYDELIYTISPEDSYLFDVDPLSGMVLVKESLDSGVYNISLTVTDGQFIVPGNVLLTVENIDSSMAENAVIIRLKGITPKEFMLERKDDFVLATASILSVYPTDIMILSVQSASDEVTEPRVKRATSPDLDVLLAVLKGKESFMRGNPLRRRLSNKLDALVTGGVRVLKIFNDVCHRDLCGDGVCETQIVFTPGTKATPIQTDGYSYLPIPFSLSYHCRCPPGKGGPHCEDKLSVCSPDPCALPKICHPNGVSSYSCECAPGRAGDSCQDPSVPVCNHPSCASMNTMTMSGSSYILWRITQQLDRLLDLGMEVRTIQSSAKLMYAVGSVDYSMLEIVDGYVQYSFDCGSGQGLTRVDKIAVNDGRWHTVQVHRAGKAVRLTVDKMYTNEGMGPGTNEVLNLNSNELFFGGEVDISHSGYENVREGFKGCMRNVRIEGMDLPLQGSNRVGSFVGQKDLEYHCNGPYVPGVCSSGPCYNGGTCMPRGSDGFWCDCRPRFHGDRCELDSNPCASNPCRNGGMCNDPCGPGRRCETVTPETRVCTCRSGFGGVFCEENLSVCSSRPCMNNGKCQDIAGSGFLCACNPDTTGPLCEQVVISVKSSKVGFNLEEVIGIVVAVVIILVLVIIFVAIMKCRHNKRRMEMPEAHEGETDDLLDNIDKIKRNQHDTNKMDGVLVQNIPASPPEMPNHVRNRPPPVPNRPVSYTPSAADSLNTLNNCAFDTARNYGSNGDDLENIGTLREPIEIPDFLRNAEVEKSPVPGRALPPPPPDEEPLLKPTDWHSNNMNSPLDHKKQNKLVATEQQAYQALNGAAGGSGPGVGGSLVSIPYSEDDMPASPRKARKKDYHWDTSDWDPALQPLAQITEVPMFSVPDTGSLATSRDSNLHMDPDAYATTDYPEEDTDREECDSEYVGDSEYNDAEVDDDEDIDVEDHLREHPDFQHILNMQEDLNYDDDVDDIAPLPLDYQTHLDRYLPEYAMSESGQSLDQIDDEEELPGEVNANNTPTQGAAENFARDEGNEVIHYGFSRPRQQQLVPGPDDFSELDPATAAAMDAMSVSMGGYTSTNASYSDISECNNLCDFEDSEINASDDDDVDVPAMLSSSHVHTDV